MKYFYGLDGGQNLISRVVARHGGVTINKGAAVMRGVTAGTDLGFAIVGASAFADIIGVTEQSLASTVSDTVAGGTVENLIQVGINPSSVYLAEYDQTATFNVTDSSGTSVTGATAIDANGQGGWLYVVSATGAGQLRYITATNNGAATITTKTAFSPVLDATSNIIRILPRWAILADFNSTADKIAPALAAGSGKVTSIEHYVQDGTLPFQRLDPTLHDGLTLTTNTKFFAAIRFRSHVLTPF